MSGLSSGALGGIVAGVFAISIVCSCIVLCGFCCWSNYEDSRAASRYSNSGRNAPESSGDRNDQPATVTASEARVVPSLSPLIISHAAPVH